MADTRPICVPCSTRYEPKKNGVEVAYADTGIQEGDLYECPECAHQMITGLAAEATYPETAGDLSARRAAAIA